MSSPDRQLYIDIQNLVSGINNLEDIYNPSIEKRLIDFNNLQDTPLGNTLEAIFFQIKYYISLVEKSNGEFDLYTLLKGSDFKTETTLAAATIANQNEQLLSDTAAPLEKEKLSLHDKIIRAQKNFERLQKIQQQLNQNKNASSTVDKEIKTFNAKSEDPIPQTTATIAAIVNQLPEAQQLSATDQKTIIQTASQIIISDPNTDLATAVAVATSRQLKLDNSNVESVASFIQNGADYDVAKQLIDQEVPQFTRFVEDNYSITSVTEEIFPPGLTETKNSQFVNLVISEQFNIDPQNGVDATNVTSPAASQVSSIIKTISQNPNDPTALATEVYSKISPQTLSTSLQYALQHPDSSLGKFIKENPHYISQLNDYYQKINDSQLGKDLRDESPKIHNPNQPVANIRQGLAKAQSTLNQTAQYANKFSRLLPKKWQTLIARVTNKTPIVGQALSFASNPVGTLKSLAQKELGKRLGSWAVKQLGLEGLKAAAKETTKKILKEGAKQAVSAVTKFVSKEVLKKGAEVAAQAANVVPGLGVIIAIAIEIADFTIGIIKRTLDKIWQQLGWGEKFDIKEVVIPLAVGGLATTGLIPNLIRLFRNIVTASVIAGTSALLILAISSIVTLFLFVVTILVAPLISTFVQLDAMPRNPVNNVCQGYTPVNDKLTCSGSYCFPVNDTSSVNYATEHHDYPAADIFRNGDAAGPEDDEPLTIVAYTAGTVTWVSENDSLGGYAFIIAGDDGRFYYYAHNSCNLVNLGQHVAAGDPIAVMGSTGNAITTPEHLHFQISEQENMVTIPENYPLFIPPWEDFCEKLNMCGSLVGY